jgi:sugar phosphate isomerase/epimerase
MNFGFSTYFFTRDHISNVLDRIAASGIKTIEISHELPHSLSMDRDFFEKLEGLRTKGFQFSMHAPFFEINLGSFMDDVRKISSDRIRLALDVACELQCDPVVVHPGYTFLMGKAKDVENQARRNFLEDLEDLCDYARDRGLRIALENVHMPVFFFHDLPEFNLIRSLIPDLGIALDVGHAFITKCARGEKDPEGAMIEDIQRVGIEHISHVHLHNNMGAKDDHLFLEGRMDMRRVLGALKHEGYEGKVIIESYDMEERGIDPVLAKLRDITP